jgi:hypothetical protein
MMTPQKWAYARRQAMTLGILLMAILGTVVIGLDFADDQWPNWPTIISTPAWWWFTIRRIATDVLVEAREDALKTIDKL